MHAGSGGVAIVPESARRQARQVPIKNGTAGFSVVPSAHACAMLLGSCSDWAGSVNAVPARLPSEPASGRATQHCFTTRAVGVIAAGGHTVQAPGCHWRPQVTEGAVGGLRVAR